MQAISFFQATRLADTLADAPHPRWSDSELRDHHGPMTKVQEVRDLCRIAGPRDMPMLRTMFAAELTRPTGPRLSVLETVLRRHEELRCQIHTQQVMDELPAFAAYMDRPAPPSQMKSGAELQAAITGALHAPKD